MLVSQSQDSKSFSGRRPILAVVIIELLLLLAVFAAGAVATIREMDYTAPVWMSFTPIAVVLIIYLTFRRRWGLIGFRSLRTISARQWMYYIPLLLLLGTLLLKGFGELTLSKSVFFIFFTLLVAFVEETIYRGLIFTILLRKSVVAATVVSSVLFSVTHIMNAMSGQSLGDTLLQLVYALLVGVVLALLMSLNGNIWPLIFFHFVHNLIQFLGDDHQGEGSLPYDIFVLVVLAAHAIWLVLRLRADSSSVSQPKQGPAMMK
ncbi:CPBP family intramembrane glutamic endopeptidase [Paenibacillus sp. JJ-223]|uniref:CPBP family intramembrane glutamic endopeptidase n=1 Tax=Paenibacillus sp. JJ-223 TaxID=2905647 RepID=UPI001F35B57D|nr:CPBP family intramembrane glutamic endopeptidase [Paenibacillus sp. JJ-223]CAH1219818.1 hypothetical protein PAECIP111890_04915 [Paenibacillus sp. JJ-223]